ncbi:hypothetical protein ACJIZ3_020567 [Penstemon smallii]|uniref:RING-type domain-containing protein n=1 Tax=Penstemon smallii TaxID=265156 RepID=A0ABD3SJL2_9LAMI
MGKRKRKADNNKTPPPPDFTPYAPQEVQQLEQRSSDRAESSGTQPTPSIMDVMGSSHKRPQGHQSHLNNQNHSSNRAMLLRHSRHIFGRHYSRRSSAANHFDASPSNWKATPVYDAKLSFKLASKDISNSHYRESMDRAFHKPERIRSSSSVLNFVSADMRKIECGICQKRLRKKPFILDNSITSSSDVSVVAVLVCGHAYHADCLEQKTNHEDRRDPPCPSCVSQDNIIDDA